MSTSIEMKMVRWETSVEERLHGNPSGLRNCAMCPLASNGPGCCLASQTFAISRHELKGPIDKSADGCHWTAIKCFESSLLCGLKARLSLVTITIFCITPILRTQSISNVADRDRRSGSRVTHHLDWVELAMKFG